MDVGIIITFMTCLFAVALTMGGPIKRQTSQSDQEGGLFTTSPGFPVRASTSMPPKPPEDNTFYLAFSITLSILIIIIIIITMCLVFKYRTQIAESRLVKACQRPAPTRIALTPVPAAPNPDNVEEGTHTPFLGSDTHGTDDVDVDDRPDDSQAFTAETREPQVPLVGRLLIDDLRRAPKGDGRRLFKNRMRKVLHSIIALHEGEDAPPSDGKYSFLNKYVWCIPGGVLADVKYCLDGLNHIPVGRKRDVYEILLTMPENQQVDKSTFYSNSNKDILKEYDQDDQGNAIKYEEESRSATLGDQMRMILETKSETRDGARNIISMIILNAPVVSASLNQQTASRLNQSASKTEQVLSVSFGEKLSPRHTDLEREDDNLIEFWLSIVIKLRPEVQRDVIFEFGDYLEKAMGRPDTKNADAKKEKNINLNDSTHLESQRRKSGCPPEKTLPSKEQKKTIFKEPPAETSSNQATGLKDEIQNKLHTQNILNVDVTKEG